MKFSQANILKKLLCLIPLMGVGLQACSQDNTNKNESTMSNTKDKVQKSEEEWKEELTAEQYKITREGGTEKAYSGKYYDHKEEGVYKCVCCGQELFSSEAKFKSGTGWPSYYKPYKQENIEEKKDTSMGMVRTEVVCSKCDAHLGHVFEDGPKPTGLRYCINSAALDFEQKDVDQD